MNGSTSEPATVIHMEDGGKAPAGTAPAYAPGTSSAPPTTAPRKTGGGVPFILRSGADGFRRCLAVIDLLLRVAALGPTLAAAISTGTSDEGLSVFTEFFQFHARFDDFPAFTFLMVANAVAAGYLVLSLPFACVGVLRAKATGVRLLLLVCDVLVMLLLLTASGGGGGGLGVRGALGERAGQLGAHLHAVPRLLPAHQRRRRRHLPRRPRLHRPHPHGNLRHPQALIDR